MSSLPNLLTLSRILAVPGLVALMWGSNPWEWLAAWALTLTAAIAYVLMLLVIASGIFGIVVYAVLPADEVLPHARGVAERFGSLPPSAVRQTKQLMKRWSAETVLSAVAVEGEQFGKALRSPEAREAFQAFFEKRKPDWS